MTYWSVGDAIGKRWPVRLETLLRQCQIVNVCKSARVGTSQTLQISHEQPLAYQWAEWHLVAGALSSLASSDALSCGTRSVFQLTARTTNAAAVPLDRRKTKMALVAFLLMPMRRLTKSSEPSSEILHRSS